MERLLACNDGITQSTKTAVMKMQHNKLKKTNARIVLTSLLLTCWFLLPNLQLSEFADCVVVCWCMSSASRLKSNGASDGDTEARGMGTIAHHPLWLSGICNDNSVYKITRILAMNMSVPNPLVAQPRYGIDCGDFTQWQLTVDGSEHSQLAFFLTPPAAVVINSSPSAWCTTLIGAVLPTRAGPLNITRWNHGRPPNIMLCCLLRFSYSTKYNTIQFL